MSDKLRAAQDALKKALDQYLDVAEEFSASQALANRLSDLVPKTFPIPKGSFAVLKIFDIPVRIDAAVPPDQIRVYSKSGDRVAAVTVQL